MADIFVSYTKADRNWAVWIAQELEELGHTPHVHEWEISAGGNIAAWMEQRHDSADHILCIVSQAYLAAPYSSWERLAAEWAAASERPNFALPVFIENCRAPTLLAPFKRCDLFGTDEEEAKGKLAEYLKPAVRPTERVPYPPATKMAFANGYEWDLFVSYAHRDNQRRPETDTCYARTLKDILKQRTEKLIDGDLTIFFDEDNVQGGWPVSKQIREVQRSAILLVMVSPSYLRSEWCQNERELFCKALEHFRARKERSDDGVLVVELDPTPRKDLPTQLADFQFTPFWRRERNVPKRLRYPGDNEYSDTIDKLAADLSLLLTPLHTGHKPATEACLSG